MSGRCPFMAQLAPRLGPEFDRRASGPPMGTVVSAAEGPLVTDRAFRS